MTFEPFKPPTAELNPSEVSTEDRFHEVPASVIAILTATRPWLRLLVGFSVAGVALMALVMTKLLLSRPRGIQLGSLFSLLVPLALVILVYGPPMIFLSRFARGIRRLETGGGLAALEDALSNQKSFWKYVGVLILVLVPLYALIILVTKSVLVGR